MKWLLLPALLALSCTTTQSATKDDEPVVPADAAAAPIPAAQDAPQPLQARSEAIEDTLHGVAVKDPYRWLEDETSPEVQAWMAAQDAHTRAKLAASPVRAELVQRLTELAYVESSTAPVPRADRLFYLRQHKDKEKQVLYWRQGVDGAEKVLLDPNAWSKDGTVSLGGWYPSRDGKKVAFQRKPNAADTAWLHVVDVDTGEWSKIDELSGARYASPSWAGDNQGFYYVHLPDDPTVAEGDRPGLREIRFHKLGVAQKEDALVVPSLKDSTRFLSAQVSEDGKVLLVSVFRGWSAVDLSIQRLGKDPKPVPMIQGKEHKYLPDVWKGQLYILSDEGAPNYRVFKASVKSPERKAWKEIIPEDKSATIESVRVIGGHLVVTYLKDVKNEVRVFSLDGKLVRTLELPGLGSVGVTISTGSSPGAVSGQEEREDVFFEFTAYSSPKQVYRGKVSSAEVVPWNKVQLPIDPGMLETTQVFFPSKDGTKIPMFIVHKKGIPLDGTHPTVLYGYGGFNVSMTPGFKAHIWTWVERGGIWAVANLRGGGEYGKAWHDAGRLDRKQNVFDDFTAASEYLVAQKYTSREKLAIYGGSNGGLLVGVAMTQHPELYGAVICSVPLLDMIRYHQFGSGKTWVPEYGTAEDPAQFKTLLAYSPYQKVQKGLKYPPLLMLSADHDDRVDPLHARKFVAALQGAGAEAHLRVEKNAGHSGADQLRKSIESTADMYAFLFEKLGAARAAAPKSGSMPR